MLTANDKVGVEIAASLNLSDDASFIGVPIESGRKDTERGERLPRRYAPRKDTEGERDCLTLPPTLDTHFLTYYYLSRIAQVERLRNGP